jgi:hypothetical protein
MSTAMLPGAPQSEELMLLTSYINNMFQQAGKTGQRPTDEEKFSMQDVLLSGTYSRADFRAAFLHAVDIACKALRAFAAAKAEVAVSPEAASPEAAESEAGAVEEVEMDSEYMGMRTDLTCSSIMWDDVIVEVAQAMTVGQMHLAVIQAFCTVAECRIRIRECFQRQEDERVKAETEADSRMNAEMEVEVDEAEGEAYEDVSSVRGEYGGRKRGSQEVKDDDRMEVDSAYSPQAWD